MPCSRIFYPSWEILEIFIREFWGVIVFRARILLVASLFKKLYSACSFSILEFVKMKRGLSCFASAFSVHCGKCSRFSLEDRSRNVTPRARILLVASLFKELYSACSFPALEDRQRLFVPFFIFIARLSRADKSQRSRCICIFFSCPAFGLASSLAPCFIPPSPADLQAESCSLRVRILRYRTSGWDNWGLQLSRYLAIPSRLRSRARRIILYYVSRQYNGALWLIVAQYVTLSDVSLSGVGRSDSDSSYFPPCAPCPAINQIAPAHPDRSLSSAWKIAYKGVICLSSLSLSLSLIALRRITCVRREK